MKRGQAEGARYMKFIGPIYGDFLQECYCKYCFFTLGTFSCKKLFLAPDECCTRALNFEDGFESLEVMDLETEDINFDFGQPGAQLGSIVDSSANEPRSITNDTPVAYADGPTVEKSPAFPRVNLDRINVALALLPVLPYLLPWCFAVSVLTINASSIPAPPPLFCPTQPSPFPLDEGSSMT